MILHSGEEHGVCVAACGFPQAFSAGRKLGGGKAEEAACISTVASLVVSSKMFRLAFQYRPDRMKESVAPVVLLAAKSRVR